MTQFSSTPQLKDQILRAVQMEQLVGEEVTLQKRGNRLTGLCPFHDEKSPSFYIFDDHYHCFGCGAHGDAISYVQAQQGLGFIDALKWLGRRFGVDVTALDRSEKKIGEWRRRTQLAKLIVDAHDFFRAKLASAQGEEARAYLRERGLSVEVCERFGVGYAPDHARELYQFLSARGASAADLSEVSLVQQYRDSYFDFYRHRVMIPIRDIQGRIVAFGGRALGGQTVKYKNSRFEKGEILFGMDQARKQMRTAGFALVVEGYFDVIAMHQAGFSQTVAVQGTALTRSHLRSLASATPRVVLLFDGDKAGAAAALKVVEASLEVGGLQVQVVRLPEGEDPDSYVRKYGPQGMSQLLEHAVDLVE
ncbi:MAG: DNA primase, partial [Zetaproteobacteria bacterium]|nr:DNA primase [Zetaproteobacteria bacterium]